MPRPIQSYPKPWNSILLLCGKCARKMDGGYGASGKETLRAAIRAELKAAGYGHEIRVVETRCMGVCPPKAVTAVNASKPDRVLTIPKKTDAAEALAQLGVAGVDSAVREG